MKATRRKFPAECETKAAIIFLTMSLSLMAIAQEQEMPGRLEEREKSITKWPKVFRRNGKQ